MSCTPRFRRIAPTLGVLACALLIQRAAAAATALQRSATDQTPPGFVVLHFGPTNPRAADACRQEAKNNLRVRTPFRESRTAEGTVLAITGHVALRFKTSTSERQIDSLIAATGIEVFTSRARPACRRFVFAVAQLEPDPTVIAQALQQGGLVEYATPDRAAGRSEGIPSDSFFVDQVALSNSIAGNPSTVDPAPSQYGIGQVLSAYTGPLLRVDAAMSAQLSAVNSSTSALDLVKSHGLTTLRLEVPERNAITSVRVVVYSLTGTPVRQLVHETLEAGRYMIGWDGKDDRGRRVQPGVYVAVMTAGNFRETRRLVVR